MKIWLVGRNNTRLQRWEKLLELVIPNVTAKKMPFSTAMDLYNQNTHTDDLDLILLLLEDDDDVKSVCEQWYLVKRPILFLISHDHFEHEWKMKDSLGVLGIDTSITTLTQAMDLVMRGGVYVEPEIHTS